MEVRCYSYDGGTPPMDSWPPEAKMGVAERAAFQAIEPIQPLRRARTMRDVAGDHFYSRNSCPEL